MLKLIYVAFSSNPKQISYVMLYGALYLPFSYLPNKIYVFSRSYGIASQIHFKKVGIYTMIMSEDHMLQRLQNTSKRIHNVSLLTVV